MPAKNKRTTSSPRASNKLKAAGLAVMTAAVLSTANAAGLGKITVLSGLGQPLNAEIELTSVGRDEAGALAVRLAPPEAFRRANIEMNPALYALRFAVEQRGTRHLVRVTSAQPLNEPFVDMLLEVSSPNSRLVREYTFLLDPPELRRVQPAQTAQAAPVAAPDATTASAREAARQAVQPSSQREAGRVPAAPGAATRRVPAAAAAGEVQVKRGDTLHGIARNVKPEGVSLDQMLVALYRANPDAFIGNNMNRVRAGQILKVPDGDAVSTISASEARGVIVAQAADFNSYRAKLAAQASGTTPAGVADGGQTAGGQIRTRIEEPATPSNTAKDRLTVSRSGLTEGGAAGTENRIAADKATADVQARVRELEKNLGDLQKLLELKNREMATLQQQASGNAGAAVPPAAASPAGTAAPANAPASVAGADSGSTAVSAAASPDSAAAGAPANATPAAAGAVAANAAAPAAKPVTPPVPKVAAPPPPPPPTLVEELLDNPLVLGAGGLLVALLAAIGIRIGRKRRDLKKHFSDSAILSETELKTHSIFGSTGGQSVDTSNSVFNSNFTPSSSQLDTNEVDPVAEADVYIAYGRDAQAEEILKEALRTQPTRHAVRVKLLEIYAGRKDQRAFETVASELYSMTRGEGAEWAQAAQLGATIDAGNPLYAGAKVATGATIATAAAAGVAAAAAATNRSGPEDLDLDALLNTTTGGNHDDMDDVSPSLVFDDEPVVAAGTASAQATPADIAAEPVVQADSNLLEFEIGDPAPAAAALAQTAPGTANVATESDGNTLDFDFDLGNLGAKVEVPGAMVPGVAAAGVAAEAADAADATAAVPVLSDLSAELGEQAGEAAVEAAADANAALDFNFDLLKPVESQPADLPLNLAGSLDADADKGIAELNELEVELPAVSFASGGAASVPPAAPLEFDLSSINLELDAPASVAAVAAAPAVAQAVDALAGNAEMATKLDLAMAYQEMGDTDGARELLDEVLKSGTPEQVGKAKLLIGKLG